MPENKRTLWQRFSVVWGKTYISVNPILAPRAGGWMMQVSLKDLVVVLVGTLTGQEQHPKDCTCRPCIARRGEALSHWYEECAKAVEPWYSDHAEEMEALQEDEKYLVDLVHELVDFNLPEEERDAQIKDLLSSNYWYR
jgi:hypothetical protein